MKNQPFPGTPFATPLARPGKVTEQRIRRIVRFPRVKRPPAAVLVLTALAVLLCGNLAACRSAEALSKPANSGGTPEDVSPAASPKNATERDGPQPVAAVPLSLSGGRAVTAELYGAADRPEYPDYYRIEEVQIWADTDLLQTIQADELSYDGDYLFEGLFYNAGGSIGGPDRQDINFDGSGDLGLLAVESYPQNVPYCYFLWDETAGRLDTTPIVLFGPVTLDRENEQIAEYAKDGPRSYYNYYRFTSDGKLEGLESEPVQSPPPSAEEYYKNILLGSADFINRSENGMCREWVNTANIRKVFTSSEDVTGEVTKFAVVDMDGDGENEVVLCISTGSIEEGFEVLHYQDGEVYGYHFWYRAMKDLAEDGTFLASGGASDTSIRKIKFLEKGYAYAIDTPYEGTFHDSSVEWYELTNENIELAFENRF